MSTMKPIFGKLFTSESLSLRNFILVMRKKIVNSPHMNVDLLAKKFVITRTTFNMPTWAPLQNFWNFFVTIFFKNFNFPKIFAISLAIVCFPKSKIRDLIFVVFVVIDTNARNHTFGIKIRQFSVIFKFFYAIIHTSVVCNICKIPIQKTLNHYSHFVNQRRDRCDRICSLNSQTIQIFQKFCCIKFGKFFEGFSWFLTITNSFIVDIRHIHYGFDAISQKFERTNHNILE